MSSRHVDTIVHDGQVVTSSEVVRTSIAMKDGKIVALGPRELLPEAERYIDASGKYVLPGAIDAHMHIDPLKCDDWVDAPLAAAHSGITSLIVFCIYDDLNGETIPDAVRRNQEEAKAASVLDYAFHFILHKQPYVLEGLPEAFDMGVTSYKMFMTYKTRKYRMCSDDFILQAMDVIGSNGGVTQLHCENGDVLDYLQNKFMSEGCTHPRYFPQACPPWAEAEAVNRAIQMGAMTNCPTYVVHLSTQGGLEKIKDAQLNGQRVWTETCPQYLLLSDAEMEKWGPHAKIGPPLRPEDGPDQEALWGGLQGGQISIVASDHSATHKEKKESGWDNVFQDAQGNTVPFGSASVETMLPLMYSEGVVKRGMSITWIARALAENPARVFGLYPRKGTISIGSDADLLLIDPDYERTITASDLKTNAGLTLYEGWGQKGRPWMTMVRGEVVMKEGEILQKPGYGEFVRCGGPMAPLGGPVASGMAVG